MTVKDFVDRLNQKIKDIETNNTPLKRAVLDTTAKQAKRIFADGLKTDGSKIGTYSTKPMLATKDQFLQESKFKVTQIESSKLKTITKGKNKGKTKSAGKSSVEYWIKFKKAKKAVPVMVLENGYKEFREIQGREGSFVNIRYSNDLQSDFSNVVISENSTSVPSPAPIKVDSNTYKTTIKRDINIKKKEWLEKKYGKIFELSKFEKENFYKVLAFEYKKAMS